MLDRVPARRSRKSASRKSSRAVAGAGSVRAAGCASKRIDGTVLSTARSERSWGRARRTGQQRRRQREEQRWSIVSDLADPLPVTSAELDVIENHLGDLLDKLLAIRPAA